MPGSQWRYVIHKEVKIEMTLQSDSDFDNFKSWLKNSIFKCSSCLNGSFFLGVMIELFWESESKPI